MDQRLSEEVANFRYRLISPIVSREQLPHGEKAALIQEAAGKVYQIPGSRKTKVSTRTIERYLKQYREGGYEALKPKTSNQPRRIPKEYLDKATLLKQESPRRPVTQIIQALEMAGEVPKGVLKHSTVYDHFNRLGITRERAKKESKAYQRFSPKHRNQRWQGDTCHLLQIPDPSGQKRALKVYLIAWLDEYSRMIPHAQCYLEEKSYTLEDSLKKAILKFGVPEQIYVDNGKVYSSNQLQSTCGRLGIHLSHTRPYRPQGRGKLERFFASVQNSFLPELEVMLKERALSLDEINDYLFVWIHQHYHERIHSATKQKPILKFESDVYPLRRISLEDLVDAFLIEDTRTVDKTGVFQLNRLEYQAPLELARFKVQVRYDPYEPSVIQVYHDGKHYPDAYQLEVPDHVNYNLAVSEKAIDHPPTNINYLELLKEKSSKGLSYSNLR